MEYFMGFFGEGYHTIDASLEAGDFQDLILWTQLTDQAHKGLETGDFGPSTPVPFNDANFEKNLKRGWYQNDTGYFYVVERVKIAFQEQEKETNAGQVVVAALV
ncbi:hypothetical protein PF003_g38443 [Phytophthora fragariae]|nr:hypothetical protein PF003_g38443 [Phytophthora fragariae]